MWKIHASKRYVALGPLSQMDHAKVVFDNQGKNAKYYAFSKL